MQLLYKKPLQNNFYMPPEWAPHEATWTCWPGNPDQWFGRLEAVRQEFSVLVSTIAQFETLHLLVRDGESLQSAQKSLGDTAHVHYHLVPLDDIWFRDSGPIFIKSQEQISLVKWEFNAWGDKFAREKDNNAALYVPDFLKLPYFKSSLVLEGGSLDVNGAGVALSTVQCLLNANRNPHVGQQQIEWELNQYLGIKKLLWLEKGLEGDHTDGHIDTIVRFAGERTILYSYCKDPLDKNYATQQHNLGLLQGFRDLEGKPFELIPLPLPKESMFLEGERLPSTYANFYIGNGFVVVPIYGDPHDGLALDVIRSAFPTRQVFGLSSRALIQGGGSFHCVTQQQPQGVKG